MLLIDGIDALLYISVERIVVKSLFFRPSIMKKSSYEPMTMALAADQWRWLEEMASKYKLSSTSKAMRCK